MTTTLVTGGARSGKSRYAEALAEAHGGAVHYVATLAAGDDEMARRVAAHRSRRPDGWRTTEAPIGAAAAVAATREPLVLLDCLSGLVSNVLLAAEVDGEEAVHAAVDTAVAELLAALAATDAAAVVVTNEVGDGVVPVSALGRWFRDALGRTNQAVAAAADRVVLVTVGIPLVLKDG